MDYQGYISLHRKIKDSVIWSDSQAVHLWIHLLLKANHKDNDFLLNGKLVSIKRGQTVTGRRRLSSETGISESKIQRLLSLFENLKMIEQQTNSKNRLISITNYHLYQSSEQQTNSKRTANEQQVNTNNNDNNDKEVNKSTKADQIPYQAIAELYNEICTNLPKVAEPCNLNEKRKRAIKKFWNHNKNRFASYHSKSDLFAEYFSLANQDEFLCGMKNNSDHSSWTANLEYLMRVDKYDDFMDRRKLA